MRILLVPCEKATGAAWWLFAARLLVDRRFPRLSDLGPTTAVCPARLAL